MRREKRKSNLLRFLLPLTVRQVYLTIITNNLNSPLKRERERVWLFFSLQIREKSLGKMERASSSLVTVRTFSSLCNPQQNMLLTRNQTTKWFLPFQFSCKETIHFRLQLRETFWNEQARGESLFLYLNLPWLLGSGFNIHPSETSWQESLMRKKRMDRGRKGVGRERRVEIVNEQIPIARIQYQ